MKRGPRGKPERNRAIYEFWKRNQETQGLKAIGILFTDNGKSLSPQRVFQIIKMERGKEGQGSP